MFQDEKAILEAELYKLSPIAQKIMKKFFAELDAVKKHLPRMIQNLPHEIWRDIRGYEGLYQVSNFGRVKSFHFGKEKLRKLVLNDKGYLLVGLNKAGKTKKFGVHILVATAFLPNLENKPEVNHRDGNKQNNHVSNLEWVTERENVQHAFRIGLNRATKGSNHTNSKLLDDDVRYIREVCIPGDFKLGFGSLAEMFGVCKATIRKVYLGKTYTDVN